MDQLTTKSARKKLPIILQTLKANHQQVNIQDLFTNNELYDSGGETPQNNNYPPSTDVHIDSPFETLSITSSSNSTPRRNTKRTANETVATIAAAGDEVERIGDEEETFVANKKSREVSSVSSGVGSGSRNKQSSVSTEDTVVVVRSPAESTNNKKARRDSAEKFVVSIKKIKKKIYKCQIITTYVQQVYSLDRKVMLSSKVLKEEDCGDVVIKKREFEDMVGKDKIVLAPIDEHLVKFLEY